MTMRHPAGIDRYFCEEAREPGKRLAVDFRVKVGHIDPGTGIVY
ncbi:MAG: hypothetical protein AAB074_05660 [Planctomycetota bacterium]